VEKPVPPAYKGRGGCAYPNCSMYGRFTYIYPQNYLNVGKQAGHTLSVWVCMYIAKKVYNFQLHCIKPSQIWLPLPKNRTNPKRKRSLSNHAFSGAMLVSGRVNIIKLLDTRCMFMYILVGGFNPSETY